MAAHYKSRGMTLIGALDTLLESYGHYWERTINLSFGGADGTEKMKNLMDGLRNTPPSHIGGLGIIRCRDYSTGEITQLANGAKEPTNLPLSNVLYFELEGDCAVIVRPSGTEPKVKVYLMGKSDSTALSNDILDKLEEDMKRLI